MNFFAGLAVSAALVCAASAANAQAAGSRVRPVSDFDAPYGGAPPAPIPVPEEALPPPAPRYYDRGYYGPDRGYDRGYYNQGYRDDRDYRYAPEQRGYGPEYGYGPSLLPPHEIYAILRENGFSPLGAPRQRGYTYVIAALDRGGEDGRLIIDGRNGRILRFVPASQWGQAYDRMSYQPLPSRDRGGPLPPPVVIKASPQIMQTRPSVANRAALAPAPGLAPAGAKPAEQPQKSAALNEARPAQPAPQTTGPVGEAKPAASHIPAAPQAPVVQLKPTREMPQVQGLE